MSKHEHNERMSRVIHYIEDNLDAEIDVNTLSNIACYSEFHFHRLFSSYVGESIYAYKKRLLLERAVKHLMYSNDNITEISFRCGYENQSSFNKAFKAHFSYTPSHVRQQRISLETSKIKSDKQWSADMKPKIINMDDIHVICTRETGDYAESASKAWGRIMKYAYSNKLMNGNVRRLGITHDDPGVTDAEHIRYDACLEIDGDIAVEEGLTKRVISGGKYAQFIHKGAYENFSETFSYIFAQWLPESSYELRDEPCFESYLNRDPRRTKPENLRTEIYVPIK